MTQIIKTELGGADLEFPCFDAEGMGVMEVMRKASQEKAIALTFTIGEKTIGYVVHADDISNLIFCLTQLLPKFASDEKKGH